MESGRIVVSLYIVKRKLEMDIFTMICQSYRPQPLPSHPTNNFSHLKYESDDRKRPFMIFYDLPSPPMAYGLASGPL